MTQIDLILSSVWFILSDCLIWFLHDFFFSSSFFDKFKFLKHIEKNAKDPSRIFRQNGRKIEISPTWLVADGCWMQTTKDGLHLHFFIVHYISLKNPALIIWKVKDVKGFNNGIRNNQKFSGLN